MVGPLVERDRHWNYGLANVPRVSAGASTNPSDVLIRSRSLGV